MFKLKRIVIGLCALLVFIGSETKVLAESEIPIIGGTQNLDYRYKFGVLSIKNPGFYKILKTKGTNFDLQRIVILIDASSVKVTFYLQDASNIAVVSGCENTTINFCLGGTADELRSAVDIVVAPAYIKTVKGKLGAKKAIGMKRIQADFRLAVSGENGFEFEPLRKIPSTLKKQGVKEEIIQPSLEMLLANKSRLSGVKNEKRKSKPRLRVCKKKKHDGECENVKTVSEKPNTDSSKPCLSRFSAKRLVNPVTVVSLDECASKSFREVDFEGTLPKFKAGACDTKKTCKSEGQPIQVVRDKCEVALSEDSEKNAGVEVLVPETQPISKSDKF